MNVHRLERWFVYSAALILLLTAIGKLTSGSGHAPILSTSDPILIVQYRYVFWIVGTAEFIMALSCVFSKRIMLQSALVAWLATSFIAYRVGLWMTNWHLPCSCLGNLTDAIHVSPLLADNVMKIVLAYLFIGSYGILCRQWWEKWKLEFGRSKLGGQSSEIGLRP